MPKRFTNLPNTFLKPKDVHKLPSVALRSVVSKTGSGVYASSDVLYKGAVFGRDSLEVAEDLMAIKPKLVEDVIRTLARLQGQKSDPVSEEEPGKIVHEYRSTVVDGKPIDDMSMNIFKALGAKWGGNDLEMAYYGSVDATPLFVRTVEKYCQLYGKAILNRAVILRDGEAVKISDVVHRSVEWILNRVALSTTGLLEYQKVNPHGISNQVWKDSEEFYVHATGEIANHQKPIASIEVQGLVYDALMAATRLFPEQRGECSDTAKQVRERIFKYFWLDDYNRFALGYDYDSHNKIRTITTKTANPAALLDTEIFDDLTEKDRKKYISALVNDITTVDFLSDAGIRSRALSEARLIEFWDYHGSYVSWPKETYDIAKGLRRQGFAQLARQLENRILNVCLKYHAYPEFVYVDEWGRVMATAPSGHSHGDLFLVEGTNQPERIQAWTVSAVVAIITGRLKNKLIPRSKRSSDSWQIDLENTVLNRIPIINRHFNPFALAARYPTYQYKVSGKKNKT